MILTLAWDLSRCHCQAPHADNKFAARISRVSHQAKIKIVWVKITVALFLPAFCSCTVTALGTTRNSGFTRWQSVALVLRHIVEKRKNKATSLFQNKEQTELL
jgi:hypothetical protein